MNYHFRQALPADVPGMQRVRHAVRENRLVSTVISDADVLRAITVDGRGWVAESGGEVVGFSVGLRSGNIWALFLDPAHEGRGYGRRLHALMLDWLWSLGLERLWLGTEPNTRAARFYRAAGWTCTGPAGKGEEGYEMRRPDNI